MRQVKLKSARRIKTVQSNARVDYARACDWRAKYTYLRKLDDSTMSPTAAYHHSITLANCLYRYHLYAESSKNHYTQARTILLSYCD